MHTGMGSLCQAVGLLFVPVMLIHNNTIRSGTFQLWCAGLRKYCLRFSDAMSIQLGSRAHATHHITTESRWGCDLENNTELAPSHKLVLIVECGGRYFSIESGMK